MTQMRTTTARPLDRHRQVWELLPWYANGTLDEQEMATVEAHLGACPACQQELARCRDIASAVHTAKEDTWSPSPKHFAQVLAQIDAADARQVQDRPWARWRAYFQNWGHWLQETPRTVRWTLALQGALVIVLGSALLWQTASSPPELYQTLSSPAEPAPADRLQLRVVFAEDITEQEIRALLVPIEAAIVKGPSPAGVYTVEVPLTDPNLEQEEGLIVERLRTHPKVRLTEPVSSEGSP